MLIRHSTTGFSLIECMISIVLFTILALIAMPNLSVAIQNGQIRSAAQSIVSGLQLARAEAIRLNAFVRFSLPNQIAAKTVEGGTDWIIQADDQKTAGTPAYTVEIGNRSGLEGSPLARIGTKTAQDFSVPAAIGAGLPGTITFNSLGRTDSTTISQIDIVHANNAKARRLSIAISTGGQIRLCDPALALSSNPQGCQ